MNDNDAVPAEPLQGGGLLRTWRAGAGQSVERGIVVVLFLCAAVATLATAAIFWTLLQNGARFFEGVSMREFLLGTKWAPDFGQNGSVPLLKGTFQVGLGAAALGIPLGVGSALYLSEFASPRVRSIVKPALEVLAGIPSIVFGIVALFIVGPMIQRAFDTPLIFSALAVTLALAVMVVPIMSSISEDAIRAVPRELRDGALALGATRWETAWQVTLPAARSGILAAILLGFGRAIGETMVVLLAGGLVPTLTLDYHEPVLTTTAFIAQRAGGDLPKDSPAYLSIFALGLLLFIITFAINLAAQLVLARQRRRGFG